MAISNILRAITIDNMVIDAREQQKDLLQSSRILSAGEELKISLLVHVTARHSPANHRILAVCPIHIRLKSTQIESQRRGTRSRT